MPTYQEWSERLSNAARGTIREWQETLVEAVEDLEAQAEKTPARVSTLGFLNASMDEISWAKWVIDLKSKKLKGIPGLRLLAAGRPKLTTGVELAKQTLKTLTPEQRLAAISEFCWHCGDYDPDQRCTCTRDE